MDDETAAERSLARAGAPREREARATPCAPPSRLSEAGPPAAGEQSPGTLPAGARLQRLDSLQRDVQHGLDELDRGEGRPGFGVFNELRAKRRQLPIADR